MASLSAGDVRNFRGEGGLVWAGIGALVLGFVALAVLGVHGRIIAPNGDLVRPLAFNMAVALYALTSALLVPLARFSPQRRERWQRWTAALVIGSVAIENVQTYRGLDPRFHGFDAPLDLLLSALFFLIGIGEIVLFLVFTSRLFRRRKAEEKTPLLLAARYGCGATALGFASGLWMSANMGAHFGEAGSILPLHALGFHGLQAVPLVALLLGWGCVPRTTARRWVHVAGLAWLGACAAVGWQTLLGRQVLELSPAPLIAVSALLVWLLAAAASWLPCDRRAVECVDQFVDGAQLP